MQNNTNNQSSDHVDPFEHLRRGTTADQDGQRRSNPDVETVMSHEDMDQLRREVRESIELEQHSTRSRTHVDDILGGQLALTMRN